MSDISTPLISIGPRRRDRLTDDYGTDVPAVEIHEAEPYGSFSFAMSYGVLCF